MTIKRIGILTGGGDAPGLNAVIRAVTIKGINSGYEIIGFEKGWRGLLDKIADAAATYLCAKIEAGVDAVQIFDTWGGLLSQHDFEEFSLQYIRKIISQVKGKDVPVIMFAKGVHYNLEGLAASGADVLGLDWTMNIGDVRKKIGTKVALQGNLDPTILYAGHEKIRDEAGKVLKSFGKGSGHIFNLGHGILPDVPPENLKALVDFVKAESGRYHLNDAKAQL